MLQIEDSLRHIEEALRARNDLKGLYTLPSLRLVLEDLDRILRGLGLASNCEELVHQVVQAVVRGELSVEGAIGRLHETIIKLRREQALLRSFVKLASWKGERARIDLLRIDEELVRVSRLVNEALESRMDVEVINMYKRGSTLFLWVKLLNKGSSALRPLTLAVEGAYNSRLHGSLEQLRPGQSALHIVEAELPTAASHVALSLRYKNELGRVLTISTPEIPVGGGERKLEPASLIGLPIHEAWGLGPQKVAAIHVTIDPIAGWGVKGELGSGGRCKVLLVEKEGKMGAMKLPIEAWGRRGVEPSDLTGRDAKDRLVAYRETLKKLNGLGLAHVVQLLDDGFWKGIPYIVEEYCEKGSLARLIREKGPLSLGSALMLGIQMAQTLLTAYEAAGLKAHNDVKPENILFDANGVALLTDFHAAYIPDVSISSSRLPGTPYYSDFENVDERSDVKGLARTIADALHGLGWRELGDPTESLDQIQPPELSDLLIRACSPNRRERPTMKAFLSSLLTLYEESVGQPLAPQRR